MLRMVLSVCGLVGMLAVQPLFAQSAQSRTDSKPASSRGCCKASLRPAVVACEIMTEEPNGESALFV